MRGRRNQRAVALAALVGLCAFGRPARAQTVHRMVLVDPDRSLRGAMRVALRPWGIEVLAVESASPGATMPSSARLGRALAERHRADAAVWISESDGGVAVWIYDARDGGVVARPLDVGPPFDAVTASEVALIVKTLLRQAPLIPPSASSEPSEEVPASPPSAIAAPEAPTDPRPRPWVLRVSVGPRFAATAPDRAEARFAVGLGFWPELLERYLGFALVVTSGPGLATRNAALSAHWTDTAVLLRINGRLAIGPFDVGVGGGLGVQITTLDGTLLPSSQRTDALRFNPAAALDATLGLRLDDRVRIELAAGSSFSLSPQTYLVLDAVGLIVQPAALRVMAGLEVGLL